MFINIQSENESPCNMDIDACHLAVIKFCLQGILRK